MLGVLFVIGVLLAMVLSMARAKENIQMYMYMHT